MTKSTPHRGTGIKTDLLEGEDRSFFHGIQLSGLKNPIFGLIKIQYLLSLWLRAALSWPHAAALGLRRDWRHQMSLRTETAHGTRVSGLSCFPARPLQAWVLACPQASTGTES